MTPRPTHMPRRNGGAGFTLLELVIAIALLGILVGMVARTASTSLQLGNNVAKTQNEEMTCQAFIDLLENRFTSLPGNTRFDVKVTESGQYLSTITLQNVPLGFTWGGQERIAKAVTLETVKRRSGFLSIVLSYYENEILEDSAGTAQTMSAVSREPFAQISLLEDVRYFEWRFLDGTNMEWRYDWDIQGRLPLQIELVMKIGVEGREMRQVFWLPPKQNIEVLTRQAMQDTEVPPGPNPNP